MRRQTALPRLAREGWVPTAPEKLVDKRAMLIPKTGHLTDHIPTLMDFSDALCPPERRALREIIETAEVVREADHLYLLARVSAATLDSLATFETSREDLEDGGDTELVNEDGTDGSALEWQAEPGGFVARSAYIAERQQRHRATYDWRRNQDELRKAQRWVSAVVAKKRKRVKA